MINNPRNEEFKDSLTSISSPCFCTWYLIFRVLCCKILLNLKKDNNSLADFTQLNLVVLQLIIACLILQYIMYIHNGSGGICITLHLISHFVVFSESIS
jgi:hypothetical protein